MAAWTSCEALVGRVTRPDGGCGIFPMAWRLSQAVVYVSGVLLPHRVGLRWVGWGVGCCLSCLDFSVGEET